jgi:type VI secretion system protein VasG
MIPINVDSESIAAVISAWTGIPMGKMVTDEVKSILTLSDTMHERVIGQQQALDMISKRIMTSRADLLDPEKPVGVFLLVGPSGVGKTETALTLADLLYGGERNLITINMSEFQEAHTVSSLKGAPPGYVGYGTGGVLTEAVRRNPYSVVLLDECEKAHPDVMELFYQVFDKGMMDDGEGVSVNFRNTVILLTSNLATEEIVRSCQEGEDRPEAEELAEAIHPILVEHFKPALLGRMVVVPYYPLNSEEVARIVTLKLNKIRRRVRDNHGASFQWDSGVVEYVSARATQLDAGARAIDNILNNQLLPELSAEVLRKIASSTPFSEIKIGVAEEGNGFTYTFDNSVTEERSISL